MKSTYSSLFSIILAFLLITVNTLPVRGQPALEESWGPPSEAQSQYLFGGPVAPGQSFIVYFEDRNGARTSNVLDTELPVYMVITTPPGLTSNVAWCIHYYPPSHTLRKWLFSSINLGASGTYRLGPYTTDPGDPYGSYAFRVGLLSSDAAGTWYWTEEISFLTLSKYTPPPPPPTTPPPPPPTTPPPPPPTTPPPPPPTVTTTYTPPPTTITPTTPPPTTPDYGPAIIIAILVVGGLIGFAIIRSRPPPSR